jgi:serine/threonine protein kinase
MPSPATADEFLDLVQRSGIADDSRLKSALNKLSAQSGVPTDPSKLAAALVREGLLTYFQADQLLQGKWKRFFIGKYKVLERLGAGGMGQVFLCEHKLMRRRVAVKVLPAAKAQDPASLERFYREARAVAALDHPNIVRAYDIDQDDSLHFLVMEYVDGTNLQDLVKKNTVLDFTRACHYIYGTAVGLQHAHEMGLVHRDIKPGNILVDRSGVVKILDMGLARFFNDEDDSLTKKYDESILGTADYLAPEQALDSHSVDIRADIYSLGATFYFLLTGSPPFPEGTVAQKLLWHQTRHPAPLRSLRPDSPPEIVDIIARMMDKDLLRRFQTPAELMAALAPWVQTPIPPPSERELPQLSPAAMSAAAAKAFGSGSHVPDGGSHPGSGSGRRSQPAADGPSTAVLPGDTYPASEPRTESSRGGSGRGYPTPYPDNATALPSPANYYTPAPVNYTPVDTAQPGEWSNLSVETRADDPPPARSPRRAGRAGEPADGRHPPPRNPSEGPTAARRKVLLAGAAATLVLGGAGAGLAVYLTRGTGQTAGADRKWYITKNPATSPDPDRTLATLRGALEHCLSGDVFVLLDDTIDEPPVVVSRDKNKAALKNIRIEAGNAAKSVTWTPKISAAAKAPTAVLELLDCEGARVTGLVIDANEAALSGVAVGGVSSGAEIENVSVRNAKHSGFRFVNLAADPARPVVLTNFKSLARSPVEAGVFVQAAERTVSRAVVVEGGVIVGPGGAGLRLQGACDVEFKNNRVDNFEFGVQVLGRGPSDAPFAVGVASNTFRNLGRGGVSVEVPLAGKQTVSLTRNLFAATAGELLQVQGGGVTAADNARDKATPDTQLSPRAVEVDVNLGTGGRPDDPRFLTPSPGSEAAKYGAKGS